MKLKLTLAAAALALAGIAGTATAQPSLYYVWKHKTTGKTMCNPEAVDANWVKVSGPYSDANCSIKEPE